MRPSRRITVAVLAAVALLNTGCTRSTPKEDETEPPALVIAEPVRLGNIRGVVSATGVVQTLPGAEVPLIAPQAGRIASISKKVGDPVTSGEVLVRFEFPSLGPEVAARAAAVRAAEVRARNARLVQERVRSLVARGAASQKEMDDADRDVTEAEAELEDARASQVLTEAKGKYTIIQAPFTGVVSARLHDPSDFVSPEENDPILRIIDPRQVQLVATVPVEELTRFTVGAAARAVAEGKPRPELLRVASRPAPEKGATTVLVNLAFESPTELLPGTQVGVEIDAEQRTNVPLITAIAVLKDATGHPYVMIAAGNLAERRPVAVGLVDTQHIEIRSGVRAGELVITQGHSGLRDGTPISASPP